LRRIDGALGRDQTTARRSLTDALRGLWTARPVYSLRLRKALVTRGELHEAARGRRLRVLVLLVAVLIGVGFLVNYAVGSSSTSTLAPAFTAAELAARPTDNWLTVAAYVTTKIAKQDRVFVAIRRRGPCVHNDQGVDRREERRDARV
jgi:hypothetical protein